jgi:hypothetical protein
MRAFVGHFVHVWEGVNVPDDNSVCERRRWDKDVEREARPQATRNESRTRPGHLRMEICVM